MVSSLGYKISKDNGYLWSDHFLPWKPFFLCALDTSIGHVRVVSASCGLMGEILCSQGLNRSVVCVSRVTFSRAENIWFVIGYEP